LQGGDFLAAYLHLELLSVNMYPNKAATKVLAFFSSKIPCWVLPFGE
jgi:hypothetical protein